MEPVICFYENGSYLVSTRYAVEWVSGEAVWQRLRQLEKQSDGEMRILALEYECGYEHFNDTLSPSFSSIPSSWPRGKGWIFTLESWKIVDESELVAFLSQNAPELRERLHLEPAMSFDSYQAKFKNILDSISCGQVYQMNFTFPFRGRIEEDALTVFRAMHQRFHGNYHAYLPLGDRWFLCFSPECFLSKRGQDLLSQPIKGTSSSDEDDVKRLVQSPKETAELSMIVDLIRNDMHRVTPRGMVEVTKHRSLMELGDLVHTYSEIRTKTELGLASILEATFPGGSITGCPKKASMALIHQLESEPRGLYTGTIGWWSGDDFSMNIAIRSLECQSSGQWVYRAGGGIVFDSQARAEFDEACLKAARVIDDA